MVDFPLPVGNVKALVMEGVYVAVEAMMVLVMEAAPCFPVPPVMAKSGE